MHSAMEPPKYLGSSGFSVGENWCTNGSIEDVSHANSRTVSPVAGAVVALVGGACRPFPGGEKDRCPSRASAWDALPLPRMRADTAGMRSCRHAYLATS